ncbi:MAG TPA: transporter substrate-binding domain-containing protein [Actinomycetota bacterium]|nr:transporter substrate-binding domain-containing protein [Actinomycetota bacterium]
MKLPLIAAATVVLLTGACGMPRDPEGTLDRVRGGTMRVGVTTADPFVVMEGDEPSGGVEVKLVEELAAELDAEIEWFHGSQEELFAALEVRELDLVIGGFTRTNPWSSKVALTHPYLTTFIGVGVPDQEDVGEDISGTVVAVEAGTVAAGLLKETDAEVVRVDDIATAEGAAAVENWLFDNLELYDTRVRLTESDHVMAVQVGENAWLTTVERFLLERHERIEELLEEEGTL